MHLVGLDTDHKSACIPVDSRPRVFDLLELKVGACNHFSRSVLNFITNKCLEYLGYECVAYETEIDF